MATLSLELTAEQKLLELLAAIEHVGVWLSVCACFSVAVGRWQWSTFFAMKGATVYGGRLAVVFVAVTYRGYAASSAKDEKIA